MYKLKYENVRRTVETEKERDKLIQEGYSLYDEEEPVEEPTEEPVEEPTEEPVEEKTASTKKGSGKDGK